MKKMLSLLTLALITMLGAYAKTTITINAKNDPGNLNKQIVAALKEKAPALAADVLFVNDLVKQAQKKINTADRSSSQTIKISKQTPQNDCVDIWLVFEVTDYYDWDGNYLGSTFELVEIWIFPC